MDYSNETLRILENALGEYKLDIPCDSAPNKEPYCGIKGEKQWFIDNGALVDNGVSAEWIVLDKSKYQERQNKLWQLRRLQQRTEYAKKH